MERAETDDLISVRPSTPEDYEKVIEYFFGGSPEFLIGMGVDLAKLANREQWREGFLADSKKPDEQRDRAIVTWLYDGQPVGHSSINKLIYGQEGFIHLHLWQPTLRKSGLGTRFFRLSAEYFAERFRLKKIYCEPYAENPAPNKTLPKAGFKFVKKYRTIPGQINFEQEVNRYEWIP